MIAKNDNLLEILEIAMNSCCRQHMPYEDCKNLASCMALWSRACEQSSSKPLTGDQLKKYIDEFNRFTDGMNKDYRWNKPN